MIFIELLISFLMIGFTSFGGTSMIPLINEQMISHGWMTAQEVSDIVAIAEMTPGPLGLNCATFAGMRTGGPLGALCATFGVLLPSLSVTLAVAMAIHRFRENRILNGILYGIRPVCIGIIASVVITLSMSNFAGSFFGVSPRSVFIGIVAFILLFRFKWTIPRTILLSGALGLVTGFLPGGLGI